MEDAVAACLAKGLSGSQLERLGTSTHPCAIDLLQQMHLITASMQGLLRELLNELDRQDPRRTQVLEAYGEQLAERDLAEDSAVAFLAAGALKRSLHQYKLAGQWQMAFCLAGVSVDPKSSTVSPLYVRSANLYLPYVAYTVDQSNAYAHFSQTFTQGQAAQLLERNDVIWLLACKASSSVLPSFHLVPTLAMSLWVGKKGNARALSPWIRSYAFAIVPGQRSFLSHCRSSALG